MSCITTVGARWTYSEADSEGAEFKVVVEVLDETKEILGGVFLTDLPDLDEAIRLAALIPSARHGAIEIRPVLQ